MKLALLGCDEVSLALARAAAATREHAITCYWVAGEARPELAALAPHARPMAEWEGLLAGSGVDAVIVARGGDPEFRAEQLRKLTQAAVPMLLSHPAHDSMLVCYELDMIRRETFAILLPYLPARWHPALVRLRELASGGEDHPLGPVEQVVLERALSERTEEDVLTWFMRDIDLIRTLCGDLTHVSALASPATANRYANLNVQLADLSGTPIRWFVEPAQGPQEGRLTIWRRGGRSILRMPAMPDQAASWSLEITSPASESTESFAAFDAPAEALAQLSHALAGDPYFPDWGDAARSVEVADALRRSLAKGRTVELQSQDYSEQATFKGIMASVGCGLLLVALLSLVPAAIAAQLGVPWVGYWLYALCGLFGLFLLLQLFKLVYPTR